MDIDQCLISGTSKVGLDRVHGEDFTGRRNHTGFNIGPPYIKCEIAGRLGLCFKRVAHVYLRPKS